MGKTDDDGGLSAEVTSRLDELFAEDGDSLVSDQIPDQIADAEETAGPETFAADGRGGGEDDPAFEDAPAKELKALVFGIDWEITDDTMVAFLSEVNRLRDRYADDKILSTFLKLHESIGKYIKAKKARAHPDAIKFVTTVFKNFEKVLTSEDMPESRKKRLLAGDIKTFKEFKERIIAQEKVPAKPVVAQEASNPEEIQAPDAESIATPALENQEALDYIVEELKKVIKAEFHTIRQILKNLGA